MSMSQVIESMAREVRASSINESGRMIMQGIIDGMDSVALKEHRCPCGRLLGKFAGQAEVKCPKCGKVNVIGGRDNGING